MTPDEMKAREIVDKLPQCLNGKDWRGEDLVFQKNEVAIEKAAHIIGQALLSERQKQRERLAKLDPLEATGDFWENGQTDDVAHGVHKWLVEQLSQEDL